MHIFQTLTRYLYVCFLLNDHERNVVQILVVALHIPRRFKRFLRHIELKHHCQYNDQYGMVRTSIITYSRMRNKKNLVKSSTSTHRYYYFIFFLKVIASLKLVDFSIELAPHYCTDSVCTISRVR